MKIYKLLPVIVFITCGLYYTHFNPSLAQSFSYTNYDNGSGGEPYESNELEYYNPDDNGSGGEPYESNELEYYNPADGGGGEPHESNEPEGEDNLLNAEGPKTVKCTYTTKIEPDYCVTSINFQSPFQVPIKTLHCIDDVEGKQCSLSGKTCKTEKKKVNCWFVLNGSRTKYKGTTASDHAYQCVCGK